MRPIGEPVGELDSFASKLERFRRALTRLEEMGIAISPMSRLRGYERLISELIDDPRPSVEYHLVYSASFAMREMDEIAEIVEYMPSSPDDAVVSLLERLHQGGAHPDDESGSAAREAQYELYLGTVARRAGFTAQHGKPDLTLTSGDVVYSLEAKRPGSEARLDDRVRHAVRQLASSQGTALLAISLDEIIRPRGRLLEVPTATALAPAVAMSIDAAIERNLRALRARLEKSNVRVAFFTARIPALLADSGHTSLGTGHHLEGLVPPEDPASQFVRTLMHSYQAALTRRSV